MRKTFGSSRRGRYDDLVQERFTDRKFPATGVSFGGLDRLLAALAGQRPDVSGRAEGPVGGTCDGKMDRNVPRLSRAMSPETAASRHSRQPRSMRLWVNPKLR